MIHRLEWMPPQADLIVKDKHSSKLFNMIEANGSNTSQLLLKLFSHVSFSPALYIEQPGD